MTGEAQAGEMGAQGGGTPCRSQAGLWRGLWRVLMATLKGCPGLLLGEKGSVGGWQTRKRTVSGVCTRVEAWKGGERGPDSEST